MPENFSGVVEYRFGLPGDALCLGVLSMQVFLDTYAVAGIRADIASEALNVHSPEAFAPILEDRKSKVILAESAEHVVAFAEIGLESACPAHGGGHVEIVRLYVHQNFQRLGLGQELCRRAEHLAFESEASPVWLAAWSGNTRALAFYTAIGYKDIGRTEYVIEGTSHENRVFASSLPPA